jgi:hypothetical protein
MQSGRHRDAAEGPAEPSNIELSLVNPVLSVPRATVPR